MFKNFFFEKVLFMRYNVLKKWEIEKVTDDIMRSITDAICMLNNYGNNTDTFILFNFSSMATMVALMCLNVALHVSIF